MKEDDYETQINKIHYKEVTDILKQAKESKELSVVRLESTIENHYIEGKVTLIGKVWVGVVAKEVTMYMPLGQLHRIIIVKKRKTTEIFKEGIR
jgi:hypothetical protein